jgi:hypothetical protein
MLTLNNRIYLLNKLGAYMCSDSEEWLEAQYRAVGANAWFTPEGIKTAVENIAHHFLQRSKLEAWITNYQLPTASRLVGIVMAGNIPLVGFHDFLCGFISGHNLMLKLSSKDEVLMKHIAAKLCDWEPQLSAQVQISDMLKGCDAYIATGSNNTARYFEQYFARFPHLIRKNRTSIAILDGTETEQQLIGLSNDIFSYFGLGCRNVTQVNVPRGYDLTKLLHVFDRYKDVINHNKYKNNYDYYLAIYLLNKVPYLTNDAVLLVENELPFSAVAVLHYRYYDDKDVLVRIMEGRDDIQCIVGNGYVPFGAAQRPGLTDYPDGVDTMAFLCGL